MSADEIAIGVAFVGFVVLCGGLVWWLIVKEDEDDGETDW